MVSPFHASLDTPLLDFGGQAWTIRASVEAVLINGAPGSGKSSASAKTIRKALLRAGYSGTFLTAKIDEADTLIKDIREAGREADLVVIDESAEHRFNVLDYAARTLGKPGFEGNIVEVMRRMSEAARISAPKGSSDGGENKFFEDGAMKWLTNAFPLLLMTEGTIRLSDLNRFLATLPDSMADVTIGTPQHEKWKEGYCYQVHQRAFHLTERPGADPNTVRLFDQHGSFFREEIPRLDNRPRSSILATLTNLIYPFLSGKLAELFTTDTTITPDACRHEGKIVILNLPPIRYGAAGLISQNLWKFLFGVASRNNYSEGCRPVFLYADEVQNFLSAGDADFLAEARSSKICSVFITQDIPTFSSKLGEVEAERLLGLFGTRIFHANNSYKTNLAVSDLIYKVQKFHVGENISTADNTGNGANQHEQGSAHHGQRGKAKTTGQTSSGYMDYEIPPDHFSTKLRTGTKRNGYKVDGIIVRTGELWKQTGRHWVQAEFDQRV